ncbi:MAG: AMP-binding protein [Desulfopila sp.]
MLVETDVRMTLNYVLDESCTKYGDQPAVGMALAQPLLYRQLHLYVISLAASLQREGLGKGDRVAILAENSHFWGIAYLASVRLGAVVVPILPDLPESDVRHILTEMQVRMLFTTQRQIEKIYELKKELAGSVITLDDYQAPGEVVSVRPFSALLTEAVAALEQQDLIPEFMEVAEDDLASIIYTSGTSGYSKAVMLSHKNLTSNGYAASRLMQVPPGSVFLSILPMSHTYEFTLGFIMPLLCGCRIAYAGKTPTPAILQNLCQEEKPFAIFAVPLVMEKIYKKRVLPKIAKSPLLRLGCRTRLGQKLVYRQIGKKLVEFLGGNLQLMGIGGAALNPETEEFLRQAEFPYLIGYGLTESSPLLSGGPMYDKTIAVGSAGKPIPGVEIRIADPAPDTGIGEIHAAGPNVMRGYYEDGEGTALALSPDGWLATGDLGFLDEQGNLHICGRLKNVIVMANGENVYPEAVEHKINALSWVVESMVLENNGQLEAWVYPDYEVVDELTIGKNRAERRIYLEELLEDMRQRINDQVADASRLARVFERREPFIKTATHKIKRYLYHSHTMAA